MEKENKINVKEPKPVEELTFSDDFMFSWLMHDPKICTGVIERLLGIKVDKIVYQEIQKTLRPYYDSKGVRFDVYLKDSSRIFDIEIQNVVYDSLPLRTRYYQSLIDTNDLMSGHDYSELSESYVVFICKQDRFGKGLPRYTFRNVCTEDGETELGDMATKVFVNASAFENEKDLETRAFLHYILTREVTTDFTKKLEQLVKQTIANHIFRAEYGRMNLHERDIRVEERRTGRAEGRAEAKAEAQKIIDEKNSQLNAKDAEIAQQAARIHELEAALAAK